MPKLNQTELKLSCT